MTDGPPAGDGPPGPAARRRGALPGWLLAAVAVLVVAAVVLGAVALAVRRDRDRQAEAVAPATTDPGSTTTTVVRPFDPARGVDLSGVPGVTADEQRTAEDLVRRVLAAAPRWADPADAEAAGYRSAGDAYSGVEHLYDWSSVVDGRDVDVDRPEGLVYAVGDDGSRTLAGVQFLGAPGTSITTMPALGGTLTPWAYQGDLCLDEAASPPAVVAFTDAAGSCPGDAREQRPSPSLHVWVVRHPCGPFSELEAVAGGDFGELLGACYHRHQG